MDLWEPILLRREGSPGTILTTLSSSGGTGHWRETDRRNCRSQHFVPMLRRVEDDLEELAEYQDRSERVDPVRAIERARAVAGNALDPSAAGRRGGCPLQLCRIPLGPLRSAS